MTAGFVGTVVALVTVVSSHSRFCSDSSKCEMCGKSHSSNHMKSRDNSESIVSKGSHKEKEAA